ncbi:DUF72 domain-containing protein [bacterium]|nr:DUF72 domain-containing protein [bacterium]
MIKMYIGTSGFSYKSWKGVFYPQGIKDMLQYYSKYFNSVEINASFYRVFNQDFYRKLIDRVPESFKFIIKVNQTITHVKGDYYKEEINHFKKSLRPLLKSDHYGGILLQFPFSFKYNKQNMNYLEKLVRFLPIKKSVEFRHNSWATEFVYNFFKENNIALVNVDIPKIDNLFPVMEKITGTNAYFRFHGRLAEKWWNYREPYERYNYFYNDDELVELLKRIKTAADHVKEGELYIFFNNHYQAKAVKNAIKLGNKLNIIKENPFLQDSLF